MPSVIFVGETNWRRRKNTNQILITHQNFTWKIQIGKNHVTARKSAILSERLQEKKRESYSRYVFTMAYTHIYHHHNSNDGASPFIEKTRVTSCEITKLSLTHVFEFYRLRSFQAESLICCASSSHHSAMSLRVLLCLDASECSSGVISSCYYRARPLTLPTT